MEMIDVLYISALVFAVAFLIFVIYLSATLVSVRRTVKSIDQTLSGMEKQLQGIATETEILIKKTNRLADDLQYKSESLNVVFDLVHDVGESLTKVKASFANFGICNPSKSEQNGKGNWLALATEVGKRYFQNKKQQKD